MVGKFGYQRFLSGKFPSSGMSVYSCTRNLRFEWIFFPSIMQLETFKRTLMQSLQEDDENPNVSFQLTFCPACIFSLLKVIDI